MSQEIHRITDVRSKNVVIFIAAMFVGVMAYTGDIGYTPVVLLLLLIAAAIGRYSSE
ncbi:hypothetical protein [Halorubrum halophilum]|uniref:hypothetical protein n=1 Tax=Halorubrum halophilum TaxID=413816 RepID=UPI00186B329F|nr:hypothetical protein [Halorubrum halophilum]